MRKKVILICSDCLNRNYTITKNQTDNEKRFEIKKFCSRCNKHTTHKETK